MVLQKTWPGTRRSTGRPHLYLRFVFTRVGQRLPPTRSQFGTTMELLVILGWFESRRLMGSTRLKAVNREKLHPSLRELRCFRTTVSDLPPFRVSMPDTVRIDLRMVSITEKHFCESREGLWDLFFSQARNRNGAITWRFVLAPSDQSLRWFCHWTFLGECHPSMIRIDIQSLIMWTFHEYNEWQGQEVRHECIIDVYMDELFDYMPLHRVKCAKNSHN